MLSSHGSLKKAVPVYDLETSVGSVGAAGSNSLGLGFFLAISSSQPDSPVAGCSGNPRGPAWIQDRWARGPCRNRGGRHYRGWAAARLFRRSGVGSATTPNTGSLAISGSRLDASEERSAPGGKRSRPHDGRSG